MNLADPEELLDELRDSVARVYVLTDGGKKTYKKIDEVLATDQIILKDDGTPMTMATEPGRPSKDPKPVESDTVKPQTADQKLAAAQMRREKTLKADKLLKAAKNPDDPYILNLAILALAEEQAELKHERQESARQGLPVSQLSIRRSKTIQSLIEVFIKRQEKMESTGLIDLDSKPAAALMTFLAGTFREVLDELKLRPELVETIFGALQGKITDAWKTEARMKMQEAVDK